MGRLAHMLCFRRILPWPSRSEFARHLLIGIGEACLERSGLGCDLRILLRQEQHELRRGSLFFAHARHDRVVLRATDATLQLV